MGLLQDATGILSDNATQKAVLYILKPDLYSQVTLTDIGNEANKLVEKLSKSDKVAASAGEMLKKASGWGSKKTTDKIYEESSDTDKFIKMSVQYNPATIRLYSLTGKQQNFNNASGLNHMEVANFTGKSKLSFDLVFDDMDPADAFMLENLTPNVGNIYNKAKDLTTHGLDGHSVRKRMDALLSLISSCHAQQVIFSWAKMHFRGTLTNVNNHFTMFNTRGNPVRGTVHLEITQEASKNGELVYKQDYWDKAFYAKFDKGAVGKRSTFDALTNNNFLNLNL